MKAMLIKTLGRPEHWLRKVNWDWNIQFKAINLDAIGLTLPTYKKVTVYFVLNSRFIVGSVIVLLLLITYQLFAPTMTHFQSNVFTSFTSQPITEPSLGSEMVAVTQEKEEQEIITKEIQEVQKETFLIEKQLLITQFLIQEKVARTDQLSNDRLLTLHQKITALFEELVLDKMNVKSHVYQFFTDHTDLNKIETALMEQAKFGVPASIKLAQAALETAYGTKVMHNNYFGIKQHTEGKRKIIITTEYYTAKEVKRNESKILSKEDVLVNGKTLYKCKVKDYFADYASPWESFRAHSVFLSTSNRYAPLFTKGKNYEAWADKIGSTKDGGVGYATSPIYGNLLKQIIKKYHLDLLDY